MDGISAKQTVYIETSIPSFYCEIRTDPMIYTYKELTHQWWDNRRNDFELRISPVVKAELGKGDYPTKECTLNFIEKLPMLEMNERINEIAEYYIAEMLMPKRPIADALHLSFSSFYNIDFLLTWNCRHLANANKFIRFRAVNRKLNLNTPEIVTPMQLM